MAHAGHVEILRSRWAGRAAFSARTMRTPGSSRRDGTTLAGPVAMMLRIGCCVHDFAGDRGRDPSNPRLAYWANRRLTHAPATDGARAILRQPFHESCQIAAILASIAFRLAAAAPSKW